MVKRGKKARKTNLQKTKVREPGTEEASDKDKITSKDVGMGMLVLGLILVMVVIMFSAFNPLVSTNAEWGLGDVGGGAILFGVVGLLLLMVGGMVLLYPRWSRKI